jgi:hypothetical protein
LFPELWTFLEILRFIRGRTLNLPVQLRPNDVLVVSVLFSTLLAEDEPLLLLAKIVRGTRLLGRKVDVISKKKLLVLFVVEFEFEVSLSKSKDVSYIIKVLERKLPLKLSP